MRFDTFNGPMDIPSYVIYVLWALVTTLNIALIVYLWPYRNRTIIKFVISVLCADLVQVMISMVEAVGIGAMREYTLWCSVSVSAEEAAWGSAGYSLLLLCIEVFFRSSWRRGLKRRTLRTRATLSILAVWVISFAVHSITIPFYRRICEPYTMDDHYNMVYKISLVSMNLLVPMAWGFMLLLKTGHNFERNLQAKDDWTKDLCVILLINFVVCWVVKQLPTIVFWEYREVFTVTDNVAYILSNVRCLIDSIVLILFFSEITSLGTCECIGELTAKTSPIVMSTHGVSRGHQPHQASGARLPRNTRAHTPPPLANANDL